MAEPQHRAAADRDRPDGRGFCAAPRGDRAARARRTNRPHRLPEIRHADPSEDQGPARGEAEAARLHGRVDGVSRPARSCSRRSTSARSISARPARRRRSSRRPPARRSSMSATSRPRPRARRSWCPRTARSRRVADLKGKNVALNKGSNVHYLLVKALEKAGRRLFRHQDLVPAAGRCPRRVREGRGRRLGDLGPVPGRRRGRHRRARSSPTAPGWSTTTSSTSPRAPSPTRIPTCVDAHHRLARRGRQLGQGEHRATSPAQFSPALGIPGAVLEVAVEPAGLRREADRRRRRRPSSRRSPTPSTSSA